jgi:hypothetical protein
MKWMLVLRAACLTSLAACGGSSHPAKSPENDGTSAGSDPDKKGSPEGPPGVKEGKPSPCAGSEIADLTSVLAQSACEAKGAKPDSRQDVSNALEIKVALDVRKVAPGGKATVTVTYHNKGSKDLPLYFVVDPEPRFELQVRTPKGARLDRPAGAEPALPADVANAAAPDKVIALVTIAPQGTATASLPFEAVRHRWASKDAARGAMTGHGYPQEAAGPLPRGKYVLRVVTPLVGVSEGIDHEVTQPRLNFEVGTP